MNTQLEKFGAEAFDALFECFCEGDFEIEVNDLIIGAAQRAGLVEKVPFDPEQHNDNTGACEPGDEYFIITAAGREAIHLSRDTDGSPEGPDRNGLDGEAATAGAEGIARDPCRPTSSPSFEDLP